jgi:hypothetical protein
VQAGEGKLRLGFDTSESVRPHAEIDRELCRAGQDRRLADPWLAHDEAGPALAVAGSRDEFPELGQFRITSNERLLWHFQSIIIGAALVVQPE